jgi:glutamyl-tRNA synthetase
MLSYFYAEPDVPSDLLVNAKQKVTVQQLPEILEALIDTLSSLSVQQWNQENLEDVLLALAKTKNWKNSQVLWPLRAALTGLPFSPGAFEVAVALGKDVTLRRLSAASGHI